MFAADDHPAVAEQCRAGGFAKAFRQVADAVLAEVAIEMGATPPRRRRDEQRGQRTEGEESGPH
ncbi:MAG TPA: hypothetical protein VGC32_02825 [Solirubrobacterales bacterium]